MKPTLLALSGFVLLAAPLTARAQFTYVTNNGTITITGSAALAGDVVIPGEINGLPVTTIGTNAFCGWSGFWMTSVTIPDSVTTIESGAFDSCPRLATVTLGTNVKTIGDRAFSYCTNLIAITIPDRVTTINTVTNIGDNAFYWCSSLTRVTIPDSVISLGRRAFCRCFFLTNATIGRGIRTIQGGGLRVLLPAHRCLFPR